MPSWGPPVLIDSHSHIDMRQFSKDRDAVMERAREAGLAAVLDVGCDIPSSEAAIALAERYDEVFAVVGFHPHSAAAMGNGDIGRIIELAQHPRVVAIGEIGLDFYRNLSPREAQVEAFNRQLDLARELDLPVVIHSRQATDEVFDILSRWAVGSSETLGVLHCFSGDLELARRYIDMGFFISIAGPITYGKSSAADVARHLPLDRLLIETDCPFLTPNPHRGKRNEPSYVSFVAEKIGELRGIPGEEVARCTAGNAIKLFRLPIQAEGETCR